jgi:integrase
MKTDVLYGDAYDNFVLTCKSESTRNAYIYGLKRFMKFLQITDVNNLMVLAQDPKALQQKIIDYIQHMKAAGNGTVSIETYLASVMHFYEMNDITLNKKRIYRYIPERKKLNKDRAYTTQQISKILEWCDFRNRAIVLLFASTGMRIGAVPPLRMEHLTKIEKYNLYQITVYSGYPEEYVCFCTPEATKAIDEYLAYRERCGEPITPKSLLFREQFDINDLEQVRKRAKPISDTTISEALRKILHKSGILPIDKQERIKLLKSCKVGES